MGKSCAEANQLLKTKKLTGGTNTRPHPFYSIQGYHKQSPCRAPQAISWLLSLEETEKVRALNSELSKIDNEKVRRVLNKTPDLRDIFIRRPSSSFTSKLWSSHYAGWRIWTCQESQPFFLRTLPAFPKQQDFWWLLKCGLFPCPL